MRFSSLAQLAKITRGAEVRAAMHPRTLLLPPILLGLPPHRRCRWVLHLEPVRRAPRAVRRVLPLRHDAFEPHLAGMGEDGRAVAFDMLVEPDTGASLGHDRCERGLAD
jgi:hypothetical protein